MKQKPPYEVPPQVLAAVKEAAKDGKLTCLRAHQLAAELGVAPRVVGAACDQLGIKIVACQLGCF
ncbi:hypothetical protein [Ammonifex thiophilus]|uniref:Uncharacterized protein n=1 Tax=Ammonifex thiophilus TaxID=444093 RepID=A0A3D8P6W6_9THEO|nr:hypothetical protein [Ammonifex thiophilus]RDV84337.1 hypothetical protein DXX99_03270 [Ammonifex thiophilus]